MSINTSKESRYEIENINLQGVKDSIYILGEKILYENFDLLHKGATIIDQHEIPEPNTAASWDYMVDIYGVYKTMQKIGFTFHDTKIPHLFEFYRFGVDDNNSELIGNVDHSDLFLLMDEFIVYLNNVINNLKFEILEGLKFEMFYGMTHQQLFTQKLCNVLFVDVINHGYLFTKADPFLMKGNNIDKEDFENFVIRFDEVGEEEILVNFLNAEKENILQDLITIKSKFLITLQGYDPIAEIKSIIN